MKRKKRNQLIWVCIGSAFGIVGGSLLMVAGVSGYDSQRMGKAFNEPVSYPNLKKTVFSKFHQNSKEDAGYLIVSGSGKAERGETVTVTSPFAIASSHLLPLIDYASSDGNVSWDGDNGLKISVTKPDASAMVLERKWEGLVLKASEVTCFSRAGQSMTTSTVTLFGYDISNKNDMAVLNTDAYSFQSASDMWGDAHRGLAIHYAAHLRHERDRQASGLLVKTL